MNHHGQLSYSELQSGICILFIRIGWGGCQTLEISTSHSVIKPITALPNIKWSMSWTSSLIRTPSQLGPLQFQVEEKIIKDHVGVGLLLQTAGRPLGVCYTDKRPFRTIFIPRKSKGSRSISCQYMYITTHPQYNISINSHSQQPIRRFSGSYWWRMSGLSHGLVCI